MNKKVGMLGFKSLADEKVKEIQLYYDDNHTLRDCQKIFGYCRQTLIKYLKTRSRTKLHDEQKRKRNVNGVICWRQRTKKKLVEYKGGKCKCCGYNKYIGNLTFHHLDPMKKDITISGTTISFEKLKNEVDKCELVCHNCHGEIHAGMITI